MNTNLSQLKIAQLRSKKQTDFRITQLLEKSLLLLKAKKMKDIPKCSKYFSEQNVRLFKLLSYGRTTEREVDVFGFILRFSYPVMIEQLGKLKSFLECVGI